MDRRSLPDIIVLTLCDWYPTIDIDLFEPDILHG